MSSSPIRRDIEPRVLFLPDNPRPVADHGCMKTATRVFEVRAIPPDVLHQLRHTDDDGRPPVLQTDDAGGQPLRCCLRPSQPGERIALVSYAPLRRWARDTGAEPGPYDEVGPVFIHPGPCAGPDGTGYPDWLARSLRVLRAYDAGGHILGGRLIEPSDDGSPVPFESALAETFADPHVSFVHARAVEFGCFTFEVRRVHAD
jgi:hypothetical protein